MYVVYNKSRLIICCEQHGVLRQRHPLKPGIGEQEYHQSSKDSDEYPKDIENLRNLRKGVKIFHSSRNHLGDAHQGSGNAQDEAKGAEEYVERHEGDSQVQWHGGVHVEDEPKEILSSKQDHRRQADPGMEGVEIGLWRIRRVVGIEHGHQSNYSTDKCSDVDDCMDDFQVLLARISEAAVDQNG